MVYSTKQREILIDYFKLHPDERFTAKEIFEGIADNNISLSAIYRNIARLEKDGILQRFSVPQTNEIAYKYTRDTECENHIHIICTNCGKTIHLEKNQSKNLEKVVLNDYGFNLNKSKTIIYGVCKNCN